MNLLALPKVLLDHRPVALESGDWSNDPSYFKFENIWFHQDRFHDMVQQWWQGYVANGTPDLFVSQKLKLLKKDLVTWNLEVFGKQSTRTNKVMEWQLILEQSIEGRVKTQEEKSNLMQL